MSSSLISGLEGVLSPIQPRLAKVGVPKRREDPDRADHHERWSAGVALGRLAAPLQFRVRFPAVLIKACLNGARRPEEHPAIPVSPEQLAAEARRAVLAGA